MSIAEDVVETSLPVQLGLFACAFNVRTINYKPPTSLRDVLRSPQPERPSTARLRPCSVERLASTGKLGGRATFPVATCCRRHAVSVHTLQPGVQMWVRCPCRGAVRVQGGGAVLVAGGGLGKPNQTGNGPLHESDGADAVGGDPEGDQRVV